MADKETLERIRSFISQQLKTLTPEDAIAVCEEISADMDGKIDALKAEQE